jgi:beta-N-acetylhexosaminidase
MSKSNANPGRHLCVGIPGLEVSGETRRLLATVQPAGIILFARNIDSSPQLRELTRQLRELLPAAFIAVDQEGKRVNRLRAIVGELPGIAEVKQTGRARELGRQIGASLRAHGIDLNFAPVLDLETGGDNALAERCWGTTPEEVIRWAGEFLAGMRSAGVRACGKHFPGLGNARQDSHEVLPVVATWNAAELQPFTALPLPALMVSHAVFPALDARPASVSRKIMTGLLREQLGFTGTIFTDDMEMGAIRDFEGAVVEAVRAGADIVLVCHTPAKMMAAYECLHR